MHRINLNFLAFFIKTIFRHTYTRGNDASFFYVHGGDNVFDKLISLLSMTLKFILKDTAKDKAELVMAIASLVREIRYLVKELRKKY